MEKYWINGLGYYDPTVARAIENENSKERAARNKQVHDTIRQIKNILESKDLQLLDRIQVKDRKTKKEYR